MHRLHLYRRVRLPQRVSWYDTKQSKREAGALGNAEYFSLPLLPGTLLLGGVAPDWVLSMSQIELLNIQIVYLS